MDFPESFDTLLVTCQSCKSKWNWKHQRAILFESLGVSNPDWWVQEEHKKKASLMPSILFLREAWSHVVSNTDSSWIDLAIAESKAHFGEPCTGIGPALQRIRKQGVDPQDITDVARIKQFELLYALCEQLEGIQEWEDEDREPIAWGLFVLNDEGNPATRVTDLIRLILAMDPSGLGMQPREVSEEDQGSLEEDASNS